GLAVAMNEPAPSEVVQVGLTTPEFFDALGVAALHGRTLSTADANESGDDLPAVLSYAFWRRRFESDPAAIGGTVTLQGHHYVIVAIMPPRFNGIAVETSPEVRVPLRAYPLLADPGAGPMEKSARFEVAARLRPRTSLAQAQAEALPIWRATTQDYYRNI